MKTPLTDYIVQRVFTHEELEVLQQTFDENKRFYLDSLELDPFTDDDTPDVLAYEIKRIFDERGNIEYQESEIIDLVKMVEYACL